MVQAVIRIEGLPQAALDAAAAYHAEHLPRARAALAGEAEAVALVFPRAAHDHTGWRRAAVADLARAAAPCRVNGVAGDDAAAITATLDWLAQTPGITGQLLEAGARAANGA